MNELAIFDLDHTLIGIDCELAWSEFLQQQGWVTQEKIKQMHDFFNDYENGELDFERYIEVSVGLWHQLEPSVLQALLQQFIEQQIAPNVFCQVASRLKWHLLQGHTLMLATASNQLLGKAIGQYLGFQHIIATNLQGHFDNKIKGTPSFGEGKLTRVQSWIAEQDASYEISYFYSDSRNDIPLLAQANQAICVNPDGYLARYADAQNWVVVQWHNSQTEVI